ncbi:MAG: hypothetical protein DMG39_27125 [Acidobacteria bacterium]|nr:MAG: hypothetical protein DMG39_27125 [Acidobacteriota bacterium]
MLICKVISLRDGVAEKPTGGRFSEAIATFSVVNSVVDEMVSVKKFACGYRKLHPGIPNLL